MESDLLVQDDSVKKLRSDMIADAKSVNNCLTDEWLQKRPIDEVYGLTHPIYRHDYDARAREIRRVQVREIENKLNSDE